MPVNDHSEPRRAVSGGGRRRRAPAPDAGDPRQLGRRARRLWSAVGLLGVAAVALRLWVETAVTAWAWSMPEWVGLPLLTAATVAAAALPVLPLLPLVRARPLPRAMLSAPARRPGWWLPEGGLAVLPSPWLGVMALLYLSVATGALPLRADPAGPAADADTLAAGGVLALPVLGAAAWYLWRGPQLAVTPGGVVLRGPLSGRAGRLVAWADVDLSGVAGIRRRHLPVDAAGARAALSWLWVDPLYLARVLRHYADHPEHRAHIGDDLEGIRLRAALATPEPAVARQRRPADSTADRTRPAR